MPMLHRMQLGAPASAEEFKLQRTTMLALRLAGMM
jgi:hypothetical protein